MHLSSLLLVALPTTGIGYLVLGLLIGGESAGLPLPGETALITAGVLASQGELSIVPVIAVAATAAIVGDNIGYFLGRHGARRLLTRPGRLMEDRLPRPLAARPAHHGGVACRRASHAVAPVPLLERRRRHLVGDLRWSRRLPAR